MVRPRLVGMGTVRSRGPTGAACDALWTRARSPGKPGRTDNARTIPRRPAMAQDVVFIHGMFMNPKSWGGWVDRFTQKGFRCHTVAWPGHEGEPAELRRSPPAVLRELTLEGVVQAHRTFLETLPG